MAGLEGSLGLAVRHSSVIRIRGVHHPPLRQLGLCRSLMSTVVRERPGVVMASTRAGSRLATVRGTSQPVRRPQGGYGSRLPARYVWLRGVPGYTRTRSATTGQSAMSMGGPSRCLAVPLFRDSSVRQPNAPTPAISS